MRNPANVGSWNSGSQNSGKRNSGERNSGSWNSGDRNKGNGNSGDSNSGNWNSGNGNSGDWNSGSRNSGYGNTGNGNSGYRNSGEFNSCDNSAGIFMSRRISYEAFNKSLTKEEFERLIFSEGYKICRDFSLVKFRVRTKPGKFGNFRHMGYKASWKIFWNNLSFRKRLAVRRMPFLDEEVFYKITGIRLNTGTLKNNKKEQDVSK
jgi:hypothetical protein